MFWLPVLAGSFVSSFVTEIVFTLIYELGKDEGYQQSSDEYERKFLKQAKEFQEQIKTFGVEKQAYDDFIAELEAEIIRLKNKAHLTESENEYLRRILTTETMLKRIAVPRLPQIRY